MLPPDYAHLLFQAHENAYRNQTHQATQAYTFDNLAGLILNTDELLDLHAQSFVDQVNYLKSLVVNSEGSVIDHGEAISTKNINTQQWNAANVKAAAKQHRFDANTFLEFNKTFLQRASLQQWLNGFAVSTATLSLSFLLLNAPILALVFLLATFLLLLTSRLEIEQGFLSKTFDEFNSNETNHFYNQHKVYPNMM